VHLAAPTGRLPGVPIVELRSPLARAVVPVVAGIAFFAVLFGVLWGIAAWISGNGERITNLGDRTFEVGNVETIADIVAEDGPILFPDLVSPSGVRAIVLDHEGDDPTQGWRVFYAYPADRDASCLAEQVEQTRTFVDCDGRDVDIDELARPLDVRPVVENRTKLLIDLRMPTASTG
jgi:hypothetical protein